MDYSDLWRAILAKLGPAAVRPIYLIRNGTDMNPKRETNNGRKAINGPTVRNNLRVVRAVSWADIDDSTIADMVRLVAGYGAAVMFGVTSDQGAFSVLVLDNQNKIKEYPHDKVDVENMLSWLRDEYFGAGGKPTPA